MGSREGRRYVNNALSPRFACKPLVLCWVSLAICSRLIIGATAYPAFTITSPPDRRVYEDST